MHKKVKAFLLVSIWLSSYCNAQNTRINDRNTIGWYATNATIKLNNKFSVHAEYQWRREGLVAQWQQSLFRTGLNYKLNEHVTLRGGYAWIETFNYGDIPLQAAGKTFTEHRTFQMALLTQRSGTLDLLHRFMLEQRWIARYFNAASVKPDEWFYVNRLRYMIRLQHALKGTTLEDKEPYAAVFNEIFFGFGKNVNENVFDQNRIGVLLGYRFNKHLRIEGGFLNQILQLPREINGRNVFQYNSGLSITTAWQL